MVKQVTLPYWIQGQSLALRLLQAALEKDRVTTAYCFAGPDGVGRALTARWFVQAVLCQAVAQVSLLEATPVVTVPCGSCLNCRLVEHGNHPDVLWVEPTYLHQGKLLTVTEATEAGLQRRSPPHIRLEQVQGIVTFAGRAPLRTERSVMVVEGAETLAEAAANALLKTLEEPGHAMVILITSSSAALLATLVSRCQVIPFRRLAWEDLQQILMEQGVESLSPVMLSMAQGSPGVALQALDQWQQIPVDLRESCHQWPSSLAEALKLGRRIAKTLDVPAQLWLVDYLQHYFWAQQQTHLVRQLDTIRQHLLGYVQPQLVWEINLSLVRLHQSP